MSQAIASQSHIETTPFASFSDTPLSAFLVAGASLSCLVLGLPVWAMLTGWAAYYTRGSLLSDGAYNLACVVTGLGLGIVAAMAIRQFEASLGIMALPTVIFVLAIAIHLMRFITGISNISCYYLGVIAFLAVQMEPTLDTYLTLTAAVSLGSFAAALTAIVKPQSDKGEEL